MLLPRVTVTSLTGTWQMILPFPLHRIRTWTAQGILNVAGLAQEKVGRSNLFDSIESGDEVVITYETKHPDGSKGVNTEILTFASDKLRRAEVYFGWSTD